MRPQHALIVDLRPENPLAAVVSSLESPLTIERLVPLSDAAALKSLIHEQNPKARYTRAVVAAYPQSRFLRHATLENPSRAREESFFEDFLRSQYQLELADNAVMVLNPATGIAVDLEKVVPKEILLAGALQKDFVDLQNELVAAGLYPERLELGTLATLGGLTHYQRVQQIGSCAAVLEWGRTQTLFTICSPKRVELVRVIPLGTEELLLQLKTELGLKDDASAQKILASGTFDFKEMGATLLKRFIKEIQASAGFFEVQTGQPLKHFLVTLLPSQLSWVEDVLSRYLGLDLLSIDYQGWANTIGLQSREGAVKFNDLNRHHLGLVSLMIDAAPDAEKKSS